MHKRVLLLLPLLYILVMAFAFPAYAEPQPAKHESVEILQRKVEELETEMMRLRAKDEHYQFLKEEIQQYRKFIEQERNQIRLFYENITKIIGFIVTILIGVASFFGFKSIDDIKKMAQERIEKKLEQIEESAAQQINHLVQESIGHVKKNIEALQQIIQRETQYRNSRILAIGSKENLESMKQVEIPLLESKGIQLSLQPYPVDDLAGLLRRGEFNIVLYRYNLQDGDQQDPALCQILEALCTSICLPLMVYAPSIRVSKDDVQALNDYPLHTFANSAATLVGNLYSLTHIFSREVVKNDGSPVP